MKRDKEDSVLQAIEFWSTICDVEQELAETAEDAGSIICLIVLFVVCFFVYWFDLICFFIYLFLYLTKNTIQLVADKNQPLYLVIM
jgi:hypothetical protein